MSFDPDWLALREPADHAARDPGLLAAAAAHAGAGQGPIVDLGAGTGSTLRAFDGLLPAGTAWRLVDADERLLALAAARHPGVTPIPADLGAVDSLPLAGARLVTASALFDLMPLRIARALADRLAAEGVALYAALNYSGEMDWDPPDPLDPAVTRAFNRHQSGDKGLGPALGPDAAPALIEALRARGFSVRTAPSPWRLGPSQAALQAALVGGIAEAAADAGLAAASGWGQARRASTGSTHCTVGHADVLALPPAASAQSKTTSVPSP